MGDRLLVGVFDDGIDVDPGEPRLVEAATVCVAELLVGRSWLRDQVEHGVEGRLGVDTSALQGAEFAFE
ncbi:hypothetical protein ACWZJV_05505 [Nocardioides sp. WG-D5]